MMRIILINSNAPERNALRKALDRSVSETHLTSVDIAAFESIDSLLDAHAAGRVHHINVVFCCVDRLKGPSRHPQAADEADSDSPWAFLELVRERHPRVHLIVASHDASVALNAYRTQAEFLYLPGTYDDLQRVMAKPLSRVGWDQNPSLAIRTSGQVGNVAIADIQFVESSKRGPVVHLPGGKTVTTRGTLKALYERLAAVESIDEDDANAFVMAGSSFIVNLDNVVASGQGALVFSDGETIIVPVRKRKDIEQALQTYRRQGQHFDD